MVVRVVGLVCFTRGFVPANATERALFRKVLQEWAVASDGAVSFVEAHPGTARIRLGITSLSLSTRPDGQPLGGWAYYPVSGARTGGAWLHVALRNLGYADGRKSGWVMRH
jgi:hypothetical protein